MSVSRSFITDSPLNPSPEMGTESANDCGRQSVITKPVEVQNVHSTRKGNPWSLEECRLLVKIREDESLAWLEVVRRFTRGFPGRSKPGLYTGILEHNT